MNVSRSLLCLAYLLVCACQVKAEIFNTELVDLAGGYSSGPFGISTKQTSYDFDAYFAEVAAATLHVEGSSWNGNSPGPFKIDTQLYITIDLEGVTSSTSYEFNKKGDSVPFAIDIPLAFDNSILDGRGVINMTLDTFGVFDHMGSTVSSVALFFDALNSDIPGDFNSDGTVDGEDFLLWQRDPNLGELSDWQAGYGGGAGAASLQASLVPEPSTLALTLYVAAMGLTPRMSRGTRTPPANAR